jgi:hypothetical protein
LIFLNPKWHKFRSIFTRAGLEDAAVEQADARKLGLDGQIRDQIEVVAKSICEGEDALEAMQVLESLTRELIAEKHHLLNNQEP